MSYTFIDQILSFEGSLVWSHVNTWKNLKQINFFESYLTADFTSTYIQMWETAAYQFIFIVFVTTNFFSSLSVILFLNKIDIIVDLSEFNIFLWAISWTIQVLGIIEVFIVMLLNHLQVTA